MWCRYLRGGEGQVLDGGALGGHGVVAVGGEGDAAAGAAGEDGGGGGRSGGDGDEFPSAAPAQLLQRAAFQPELQQLGALALLRQVEHRGVAPLLQVLLGLGGGFTGQRMLRA